LIKQISDQNLAEQRRLLHINKENISSGGNNIFHIYVPNVSIPNYIKLTSLDLKTQINPNTIILGDFNTLLSAIEHSPIPPNKINKEMSGIIGSTGKIDITDIYRVE
jgi:hypothetical protein